MAFVIFSHDPRIPTKLEGDTSKDNLDADATLYIKVLLWGRIKIAYISGNLKTGIDLPAVPLV